MNHTDMKKTFAQATIDLAKEGCNVAVVDADLMRIVGSAAFRDEYPDRYFQVGIAEQDLVSTAAGLALTGRMVFATSFSNFISLRAADQVCNTVCYNNLNVKVCGIYAGISSEKNGGTHISVSDVNLFRAVPGISIIDPGDANELYQAMKVAGTTDGPFYLRISKGPMDKLFADDYKFQLGKSLQLREGKDVTLITSGLTTKFGITACEELEKRGISVCHIHMPTIKPIDTEAILRAAKDTSMIFTAENHSIIGGLGSAVSEVVSANCPTRVVRMGINDTFCVGASVAYLSEQHGFSAEKIVERIKTELNK